MLDGNGVRQDGAPAIALSNVLSTSEATDEDRALAEPVFQRALT